MFDLSKPWPPGLSRATWWRFALVFAVLLGVVVWFDPWLSKSAQAWPKPVTDFFAAVTDYGLSDWVLIPSLALTLICGLLALLMRKKASLKRALAEMTYLYAFIFIGVGLPGLISNIIKRIIGRGRPELLDQVGALDFQPLINDWQYQSFPSGHTTTSFAIAFAIGFMSPRWFPWLLGIAAIVGVSRVAVGAHYPTDVLGGMVVGTLGAYLVRAFFAKRKWLFRYRPDGSIVMRKLAATRRLIRSRRPQAK